MDANGAIALLGKNSKWHVRTYLFYSLGVMLSLPLMIMSPVFLGEAPDYRCALPANATLNESIPYQCDSESMQCSYDKCHMYSNPGNSTKTEKCQHGYWYDPTPGYGSTLVTEFDLTCDRAWLVELSMMLTRIGNVVGALCTLLSDKYGRWKVLIITCFANTFIALAQAASLNMEMYTILGFFDGVTEQGMINAGIVMILEIYPRHQHALVGVGFWMIWAIGYVALVPFVYFIRNWRYLQIAITLPMLFFSVMYIWFIDESIPWLLANGKRKKAEQVFQNAARISRKLVPKSVFDTNAEGTLLTSYTNKQADPQMEPPPSKVFVTDEKQFDQNKNEQQGDNAPTYQLWDLLKYRKVLLYSVILWFIWFVNFLSYGAITYTVTYLPGDRYMNLFWYAALEIPSYLLLYFSIEKWGKRVPSAVFHIIGGIALLVCVIQTFDWGKDQLIVIIIFSQIGKFCYTYTFGAIYLIPPDMYPTNFRAAGLGICQFFGRFGYMAAPYFRILAREVPWLPTVIYGVLSILAGLLLFVLPETKHESLPKTMEDVEKFKRKL